MTEPTTIILSRRQEIINAAKQVAMGDDTSWLFDCYTDKEIDIIFQLAEDYSN